MPSETGITSILGTEKTINKNQPNGYPGLDSSGYLTFSKTPSANIRNAHDDQTSQQSTSYVLLKTITMLSEFSGSIRVYVDLTNSPSSYNAYISIRKNGVQVANWMSGLGGWHTDSYDLATTTYQKDSTIQLWVAQPSSNAYPCYVRNFRLAYDNFINTAIGSTNS